MGDAGVQPVDSTRVEGVGPADLVHPQGLAVDEGDVERQGYVISQLEVPCLVPQVALQVGLDRLGPPLLFDICQIKLFEYCVLSLPMLLYKLPELFLPVHHQIGTCFQDFLEVC